VFGLLVGALHLFLTVNACLRSFASKWVIGGVGAIVRVFLMIAVTMASARIRGAGAEPSTAFFVALVLSPLLSFVLLGLAYHRRTRLPAGSEAQAVADKVVTSWIAVAVIDAMFVVIGLASRMIAARP
jgi:hypothetical protein